MVAPLAEELRLASAACISFQGATIVLARNSVLSMLGVALAVSLSADFSFGVPINYGDFKGVTVTYVGVSEDSNSSDTSQLFGRPTVTANSLHFRPAGFGAKVAGPLGVDVTDANLMFMAVAEPGHAVENICFDEAGIVTLAGTGADATIASVTAGGILNVYEIDGFGVDTISIPFHLSFAPSGGTYQLSYDGGGEPLYHTLWSGALKLNISAVLRAFDPSFNLGATKISVDMDNTLVAVSEASTSSSIAMKGRVIITTNFPEPGSCALAIVAVLVGGMFVRRGSRCWLEKNGNGSVRNCVFMAEPSDRQNSCAMRGDNE